MANKALYLAGGGARGAYQAGVLKAIGTILKTKTLPFDMVSGVSVGSINAAVLANYAHDFPAALECLDTMWGEIHCEQVFNSSNYSLIKSVLRNVSSIFIRRPNTGYLLDTSPLHQFIQEWVDFDKIAANIQQGHLKTLEIITQCYESQRTISFYDHQTSFEDWALPRHSSQATKINGNHILASSAIPLFFPNIAINNFHYCDGSIGLITPLRGAIRFKMDKILIIGTRHLSTNTEYKHIKDQDIGFAYILGNMMDGIFLDNLDHDIEMVQRMNEIALLMSIWKKRYAQWRPIETHYRRPSLDLSTIAKDKYASMPSLLRFLLSIFGNKNDSGELISFLLFEGRFTRRLIDLGYKDTMDEAVEIEKFFA